MNSTAKETERDIKNNMKLYQSHIRVQLALESLRNSKKSKNDNISVKEMYEYDNMHYGGIKSIDEAVGPYVEKVRGSDGNYAVKVMDVGSGFGGPARFLADEYKCDVTALEFQTDVHEVAQMVTEGVVATDASVKLSEKVRHLRGSILEIDGFEKESYDVISSFLVFLHISDKKTMFANCARLLKTPKIADRNDGSKGPYMIIEDYYKRREFTKDEMQILEKEIYTQPLATQGEYISQLNEAGFEVLSFVDMTEAWSKHVSTRLKSYQSDETKRKLKGIYKEDHFESIYKSQSHFFTKVNELFMRGEGYKCNIGGARIICRKLP